MRLGSKVVAAVGVGATVVSAAVVALAIPALGKGIASATITGPGLVRPIDDPSPNMSKLPALTRSGRSPPVTPSRSPSWARHRLGSSAPRIP